MCQWDLGVKETIIPTPWGAPSNCLTLWAHSSVGKAALTVEACTSVQSITLSTFIGHQTQRVKYACLSRVKSLRVTHGNCN